MQRPLSNAVLLTLLLTAAAWACNVPVFRYALERWRADVYVAHVFHKGPLDEGQQKLVKELETLALGPKQEVELFIVELIDVDQPMEPRIKAMHDKAKPAAYPWLHLQYPRSYPNDPPAWSTQLTAETPANLIDSPMRRQIARHILEGQSVVWLLVDSGDKEKDDAAFALVDKELKRLGKELKLPVLDESDLQFTDPDKGPVLKLSFALERVSRKDAAEATLLRLLENWDPKSIDRTQPMAFAFFGRGRVLPAVIGKDLTPRVLEDVNTYLVGKCSCQVKEENPGWDVLMAVNWDAIIRGNYTLAEALPRLTTPAAAAQLNAALKLAGVDPQVQPDSGQPGTKQSGGIQPASSQPTSAESAPTSSRSVQNTSPNPVATSPSAPPGAGAGASRLLDDTGPAMLVPSSAGSAIIRNVLIASALAAAALVVVTLLLRSRRGT